MAAVSDGGDPTVFSDSQVRDAYPDGIQLHYWNRCRNQLIASLVRRHAPGRKILDVGCGRGIVVDALRRRGIDAWGCEPIDTPPITAAVAPYLETARVAEAGCRRGAGCALILDVLEHLPEPRLLLAEVLDAAAELERVIVTVPARRELWSEWDEAFGHHRRYRRGELVELLDSAGLRPLGSGYFFHSLYVAARLAGAVGGRRSTTMRAPGGGLARLAHRAVGAALSAERRLLPAALPGSSLWAVAEVRR